ncbi:MAG: tetratricopeptide repeat protein [Planctomycetota bacterium]|jgi:Flp pilus assembly protein TadD
MSLIRLGTLLVLVGSMLLTGCRTASRQHAGVSAEHAADNSQNITAQLQQAQARERDGDYNSARSIYLSLLKSQPENPTLQHRLGVVQIKLGEAEKGLEHLKLAEAASPNNLAILNDLGFACLTTGRPEMAQQVLKTALEINPQDERATNNLAMAYGLTGQFDKAFAMFRRKLTEAEALSNLGYVASQTGNVKFATECYSRALSLKPNLKEAAEALAQLADLERQVETQKSIAEASIRRSTSATDGEQAIRLTGGELPE